MAPIRIVQVSDLHLSREFPLFLMNWAILAERIVALKPDLVLATGDLAFSDPDREDDLVFAREKLDALGLPYRVVPGNHDIGDMPREDAPDAWDHHKKISAERRNLYLRLFGDDWWVERMGNWLLLGINAQLFGSTLPEAEEQRRFITEMLNFHDAKALLLVTHKTLFTAEHGADEPGWSIPSADSEWLRGQISRFPIRSCVSGHLHREKRYTQSGTDFVWCPSTAFYSSHPRIEKRGGNMRIGALELLLGDDGLTVNHLDDARIINQDVRNWFSPNADAMNRIIKGPSPFVSAPAHDR